MNTRVQSGRTGASIWRWRLRQLAGGFCLLLLLACSGLAPASATDVTIDDPEPGPITVNAGHTLTIGPNGTVYGGSLTSSVITVNGGTLNVHGTISVYLG